jgi:hypothetical protein
MSREGTSRSPVAASIAGQVTCHTPGIGQALANQAAIRCADRENCEFSSARHRCIG